MADLVDIAISASAQAAAEALGLRVQRSVTDGVWVRQVPREEAEIAVECLRDLGFSPAFSAMWRRGNRRRDTTQPRPHRERSKIEAPSNDPREDEVRNTR
jgi:hypothetical protein